MAAELFVLLRDLGDRIASSSNGSPESAHQKEGDDVELRFRAVLPNLVHDYFSILHIKELLAILKLLTHVANRLPGVFYHGKGRTVLPIIARIIPLFAEPVLRSRGSTLFEALTALMSLLSQGDKEAFESCVTGIALLLEDLSSVAAFFASPSSFTSSTTVSITAFGAAFDSVFGCLEGSAEDHSDQLETKIRQDVNSTIFAECEGVCINVTGDARWKPLAEWMLQLLNRLLRDAGWQLFPLLPLSFMSTLASLLCYGDEAIHRVSSDTTEETLLSLPDDITTLRESLQMEACFSMICTSAAQVDPGLIPLEDMLLSVLTILHVKADDFNSPSFRERNPELQLSWECFRRTASYDAALASCLTALYSIASPGDIQYNAQGLVELLPRAAVLTVSQELKVALCEAFASTVAQCPMYASQFPRLIAILHIPEISSILGQCLRSIVHLHPVLWLSESPEICRSTRLLEESADGKVNQEEVQNLNKDSAIPVIGGPPGRNEGQAEQMIQGKRRLEKNSLTYASLRTKRTKVQEKSKKDVELEAEESQDSRGHHRLVDSRFVPEDLCSDKRLAYSDCEIVLYEKLVAAIHTLFPNQDGDLLPQMEATFSGLRVMARAFDSMQSSFCWRLVFQAVGEWINMLSDLEAIFSPFTLAMLVEAMEKILPRASHEMFVCLSRSSFSAWENFEWARKLMAVQSHPGISWFIHCLAVLFFLMNMVVSSWFFEGQVPWNGEFQPGTRHVATSKQNHLVDPWNTAATAHVLRLPWVLNTTDEDAAETVARVKIRALKLASFLSDKSAESVVHEILTQALQDSDARVVGAAILALPRFCCWINKSKLMQYVQIVRELAGNSSEGVREAVAACIGCIACGLSTAVSSSTKHHQEMYGPILVVDSLPCPVCSCQGVPPTLAIMELDNSGEIPSFQSLTLEEWQPLLELFLAETEASRVQVAAILSLSKLLRHAPRQEIRGSKEFLLGCLEKLPVREQKSIRTMFNSVISAFVQEHVLEELFGRNLVPSMTLVENQSEAVIEPECKGGTAALDFLRGMQHHLEARHGSDIQETLVAALEEVALAASSHQQLLLLSILMLIEQLDSTDVALQVVTATAIRNIACRKFTGSGCPVRTLVDSLKNELFEFLSSRLLARPRVLDQFAEAVMGVENTALLNEMIPVVLPKLVLSAATVSNGDDNVTEQQHGQQVQSLAILQELARRQSTEVPVMLLEWCHKILAHLLLHADGEELGAVLHFYEANTGSDSKNIFLAVMPPLLDELIRFLGDTDTQTAVRRSSRVVPMLQELAKIVTGSGDIPNFLRSYYARILNSVDHNLLRSGDFLLKVQALRCIEKLLELIGPHLSAFVPKVMALLTVALQEAELQAQALHVWLAFVQRLAEVSPSNLKSVAGQIVVAILPCLEEVQGGRDRTSSIPAGLARQVHGCMDVLTRDDDAENKGDPPHLAAAVAVFEELVVKNRAILEDELQELSLLPGVPALARINGVLEEARGKLSPVEQVQKAVDRLHHESLSVRYMAAKELKILLRLQCGIVSALILGESELGTRTVSQLVAALLKGCAESSRTSLSHDLKLLCAECLGEVGAIDPARLKVELPQQSKIEREDEDLVLELITEHLTKVLRASGDTNIQDAAALAIQELLKHQGCYPSLANSPTGLIRGKLTRHSSTSEVGLGKDDCHRKAPGGVISESSKMEASDSCETGQQFWARLKEDVRELIAPCLTSKFTLKHLGAPQPDGPIFNPHLSYRRWIYLWSRRLISEASGPRAHIFTACRGVVTHDMDTALSLLPYLVLNVVCEGADKARQGVNEEILAVLAEERPASNRSASVDESDGLGGGCLAALAGGAWGVAEGAVGAMEAVPGGWRSGEVSMQTVFTLLDNLAQWLDNCKQTCSNMVESAAGRKGQQSNVHSKVASLMEKGRRVENLLMAVPKESLARASFRCKAYARALLYFELYLRETGGTLNAAAGKRGVFDGTDVSFLLEIYSKMDEPDGLSGFLRLKGPTSLQHSLQDQLLIHKEEGNWAEALTCCEQALELEPRSVARHEDLLNCLLHMGHLQAMVTHVDGLVFRMPGHTREWSVQGVQAAWRLGQWDHLDDYVERFYKMEGGPLANVKRNSGHRFDMGLAEALQALHRKEPRVFHDAVMKSRRALLAPLAAAGMESYERAYPFIVKMHMLRELEDSYTWGVFGGKMHCEDKLDVHRVDEAENGLCKATHGRGDAGCTGPVPPVTPGDTTELLCNWEKRLQLSQASLWAREPILALRRLVYAAAGLEAEVGRCWLDFAKMCRRAGHYQTANRAILEAYCNKAPNPHMERAKLLWITQNKHKAISELQEVLQRTPEVLEEAAEAALAGMVVPPPSKQPAIKAPGKGKYCGSNLFAEKENVEPFRRDETYDVAKTLLLLTKWVHNTGQKQEQQVLSMYHRVRELQPQWEKSYFYLAKYIDDLYVDAKRRQEEKGGTKGTSSEATTTGRGTQRAKVSNTDDRGQWWTYQAETMINYAKALKKGHRYLFQSLPRVLTLWFDYATKFPAETQRQPRTMQANHGRVVEIISAMSKNLPTYQWLTALPQLVSRICHQSSWAVQLLKVIIATALVAHPQQALWTMAGVSKSTLPARQAVANDIINKARNAARTESDREVFIQFPLFIEHMIKLCFHQGGQQKSRNMSIGTDFGQLKRMMPVPVIMPVQKALTVTLPPDVTRLEDHNPFPPRGCATIISIQDEVEVLASLQKPKKVVLLGSDGRSYPFLCKPKDDLRKDARLMEFTGVINRLLSKDASSRRRQLYIRTFYVVPLTEDCGMIEWVLNTRGLRHILQELYRGAGRFDRQTNNNLKKLYDQSLQQGMSEGELLRTKLLPKFPPIFHKWLLGTFSEPAAWFRARLAYARTTAVWSMVGHMVGLGDRHGENILFDSSTGDCVHVDFSCLFDRGLALEKPELVPFRLTQNIVDGLGITGYEGVFTRVCESTLSVLRSHREMLMSVLETFIHDPLVEWTKNHKSSGVEMQNPHAQRALANIEARLQGIVVGVSAAPSLPLSVEGQVHRLIAEAVAHENLGRMYIWWMPWF